MVWALHFPLRRLKPCPSIEINEAFVIKPQNYTWAIDNFPFISVKFRGLIFDDHLTWKEEHAIFRGTTVHALNLLKKVASTVWGANRQILIQLYKATVLSVLDYDSPIYDTMTPSTLKSLDQVHHFGIRLCTGAFKSSWI